MEQAESIGITSAITTRRKKIYHRRTTLPPLWFIALFIGGWSATCQIVKCKGEQWIA
jgi:hypothetical protein